MTEVVIDKKVPIPTPKNKKKWGAIAESMEVGDSVFFNYGFMGGMNTLEHYIRKQGFSTRNAREETGRRLWKVERRDK